MAKRERAGSADSFSGKRPRASSIGDHNDKEAVEYPDFKATTSDYVQKLASVHDTAIKAAIPWYLENLPASYFKEVGEATRMEHLKGLVALRSISNESKHGVSLTLTSKLEDNSTEVTILRTGEKGAPGVLHQMIEAIRNERANEYLTRAQAYSSRDGTLTLNIFTFGVFDHPPEATEEDAKELLANLSMFSDSAGFDTKLFTREAIVEFCKLCHPTFIRNASPQRFGVLREMYEQVRGHEGVEVRVDPSPVNKGCAAISIAVTNPLPKYLLASMTKFVAARSIDVVRMHYDDVRDPSNPVGGKPGMVALLRLLVSPAAKNGNPAAFGGNVEDLESEEWSELLSDLRRVRWMDEHTLDFALSKCPDLGLGRSEVLCAFCAMLHGSLSKLNPFAFSQSNLLAVIANPAYTRYASQIADLFLARFNPVDTMPDSKVDAGVAALRESINGLPSETAKTFLEKMLDAVKLTLRTNFYFPDRYGLSLRLAPSLIVPADKLQPFGIFFVHGSNFNGFHNRFQNISRGGLRLVTPMTAEQLVIESSRYYDEVYGLSLAQNLKNKDIPEGGSKAVCLIDTSRPRSNRNLSLRNSVKAFSNSLLDLIVSTEETSKYRVDHLGFDELIYLGPDEQVVPEDLEWIVQQAARRGYPIPAAFMSSKPRAGFNHKQYGVTSEGVVVFLDVALRDSGIQPDKQPFTIKITGGPDGDVAGNLMRILDRDYGENAVIVGIADGSGCAEDPKGLSHSELLRLFKAGLPIADIDPSSLSAAGKLYKADTEEGAKMRNSMHNRLKADVFVPGGGRPNTIRGENWKAFLDPATGKPTSPLIVEGANIFLTPEARQSLFKAGVRIVKDSSANKCGVITSSYEICASMLLEESEFLAVKDELVDGVLKRLRELARLEAELMFREYRNYPGALPEFSERISRSINRAYAPIRKSFENVQKGDAIFEKLLPVFLNEHLPKKLAEVAGDRVPDRIPIDYLRNAFAKNLASKLLYHEGINFLESQPEDKLPQLAMRYVEEEKRIQTLVANLDESEALNDEVKSLAVRLLRQGGTRSLLGVY